MNTQTGLGSELWLKANFSGSLTLFICSLTLHGLFWVILLLFSLVSLVLCCLQASIGKQRVHQNSRTAVNGRMGHGISGWNQCQWMFLAQKWSPAWRGEGCCSWGLELGAVKECGDFNAPFSSACGQSVPCCDEGVLSPAVQVSACNSRCFSAELLDRYLYQDWMARFSSLSSDSEKMKPCLVLFSKEMWSLFTD